MSRTNRADRPSRAADRPTRRPAVRRFLAAIADGFMPEYADPYVTVRADRNR